MENMEKPVDEVPFYLRANITARDLAEIKQRLADQDKRIAALNEAGEQIEARCYSLEMELGEVTRTIAFHPRAWKLMGKRKNFVVVAEDETYFESVYRTIRVREISRRNWSEADQQAFEASMARVYDGYEARRKK